MRKAAINMNKTTSSQRHTILAYDDAGIIWRNLRDVSAVLSKIAKESAKLGVAINEDKTRLMVSTSRSY